MTARGAPNVTTIHLDEPQPDRRSLTEVLLKVSETVTSGMEVDELLDRLAHLALDASTAERVAILVADERAGTKLVPAAVALRDSDAEIRRRFLSGEPIDVSEHEGLSWLWRNPDPVAIEHVPGSPLIPDSWKEFGSQSVALAPLRTGSTSFGLLVLDYFSRTHRFRATELQLVDAIARGAGVSLKNAELIQRLNRSLEIQRRLSTCSNALLSGESLRDVLDLVIDGFAELVGVTHCGINSLAPDAATFVTLACRGWEAPLGQRSVDDFPDIDVDFIARTWRRTPRHILRIPNMSLLVRWSHLVPKGMGPGMLIPLWDGVRVSGFVVAGRTGERDFSEDEMGIASEFAKQAALAIHQAELREAVAGRARAAEALQRLTGVVVGTADLKGALSTLNLGVCADLGIECTAVTFADPILCSMLGLAAPRPQDRETMRSWRLGDGADLPRVAESTIDVPIRMNRRIAGILRVRGAVGTSPGAQEFLAVLADGIGDIAYKAKLRRTAERRTQELLVATERERMARDLHDSVGQIFYGMSLKAQHCLGRDLANEEDHRIVREQLSDLTRLASNGVTEVRKAVYELSFTHVRSDGLTRSLRSLVHQFQRASGIPAELRIEMGVRRRLPIALESVLYRVAHQALTNVERHSRATGVIVDLALTNDSADLSVRDDGIGIDQRLVADWRSSTHFGLRMMRQAVERAGGRFLVENASPRGLRIRARMPLKTGVETR